MGARRGETVCIKQHWSFMSYTIRVSSHDLTVFFVLKDNTLGVDLMTHSRTKKNPSGGGFPKDAVYIFAQDINKYPNDFVLSCHGGNVLPVVRT